VIWIALTLGALAVLDLGLVLRQRHRKAQATLAHARSLLDTDRERR
jgi:hypothetical protein